MALPMNPGAQSLSTSDAERADEQRDEERDERADEQCERERLPVQERAVRPAVDDVERGLEHAEERERRSRARNAAPTIPSAAALSCTLRTSRTMSSIGVLGQGLLDLAHEEARLVRLPREREQREREEDQGHEREEREVRDHRGEVRAAVGEELLDEPPFAPAHRRGVWCSAPWTAEQALADLTEISTPGRGGRRSSTRGRRGRVDARRSRRVVRARRPGRSWRPRARHGDGSLSQLEAATGDGSVFVVRDGARASPRRPARSRRSALVFYDLKTALRASAAEAKPKPARRRRRRSRTAPMRKLLALGALVAGWVVGIALLRRTAGSRRERVDLYFEDGSMSLARRGRARGRAPAPARARRALSRPRRDERRRAPGCAPRARVPRGRLRPPLGAAVDATTSTSTASRRRPDLLAAARRADRGGGRRARARGGAARRPGARRRRARGRGLARVGPAVPDRPQGGEGLRHRQSARRASSGRASTSASSRTSSPPAAPPRRPSERCARPGSSVRTAVCVVDREEGGVDALARDAVRLRPLFRATEMLETAEKCRKTAWLSRIRPIGSLR